MARRMTKEDHPESLGAFKPVGHVVLAMPDDEHLARAVQALLAAGFEERDILQYTAGEEEHEMDRMLSQVSDFAGFGYEVTLMRKYQQLAHEGASWLIVFSPNEKHTNLVADVARNHGALLAEKYHLLVIEDLL
jgi:hypothetical protein